MGTKRKALPPAAPEDIERFRRGEITLGKLIETQAARRWIDGSIDDAIAGSDGLVYEIMLRRKESRGD